MNDEERETLLATRIAKIKEAWPSRLQAELVDIHPYRCTLDGNFTHQDLVLIGQAMEELRKEFPGG